MKITCFFIVLVLNTLEEVLSAARGEVCSLNLDCTTANTICLAGLSTSCSKTCQCDRHFDWDATDSKCKLRRFYRDKCTTADSACQAGSTCTVGMCACAGSFSAARHECMASTGKTIDEDCAGSGLGDCYEDIVGSVECVVPTGSSGSQTKCQCKTGYITEAGSKCRKPHHGEACNSGVGCGSALGVIVDTSYAAETCQSSVCACPTTYTAKEIREHGIRKNVCVEQYSGTKTGIGSTCTETKTCSKGFCYMCSGATEKKCVADNV